MCYVCDFHCCTASNGDHCGCNECPQPLCHTHGMFREEAQEHTGEMVIPQARESELRQGYRDTMIQTRAATLTARENAILVTGRVYPEPGSMPDPAPPFAATRPDEQPGFRVAGGNLMQGYEAPPFPDEPPAISVVVGRPDVGTTETPLEWDGWGESLGGEVPHEVGETLVLPPEDDEPPIIDETTGEFRWRDDEVPVIDEETGQYEDTGPTVYPDATEYRPGEHLATPTAPTEYDPPPPEHPLWHRGGELGKI